MLRKKSGEEEEIGLGRFYDFGCNCMGPLSVFGAIPYVISLDLGPLNAIFESVAGFTATGSDNLPRGGRVASGSAPAFHIVLAKPYPMGRRCGCNCPFLGYHS